jgi:hypothetical protein
MRWRILMSDRHICVMICQRFLCIEAVFVHIMLIFLYFSQLQVQEYETMIFSVTAKKCSGSCKTYAAVHSQPWRSTFESHASLCSLMSSPARSPMKREMVQRHYITLRSSINGAERLKSTGSAPHVRIGCTNLISR